MKLEDLKPVIIEYLDGNRWIRKALLYPYRIMKYARYGLRVNAPAMESRYFGNNMTSFGANSFFGYYDMSPMMGGQVLFHQGSASTVVDVLKRDVQGGIPEKLGTTASWSFQQGAMAQWFLGDQPVPLFNGAQDGLLGAFLCLPEGKQFHPYPVELVCGDGWFSVNFKRLTHSEYGYERPARPDNFAVDQALDQDGIWFYRPGLRQADLIIRLSDLNRDFDLPKAEFINHLSISRDGRYLLFIHRIIGKAGRRSRLYMLDRETGDLKLILDEGFVSHYCWMSDRKFLVFARHEGRKGYFEFDADTGHFSHFMEGSLDHWGDGHPTASPDGRYVLTDTYPDKGNRRHLIIVDCAKRASHVIGSFRVPFAFFDDKRCDLHPRWSHCGEYIFFDSAHTGNRELYCVPAREVLHAIQ